MSPEELKRLHEVLDIVLLCVPALMLIPWLLHRTLRRYTACFFASVAVFSVLWCLNWWLIGFNAERELALLHNDIRWDPGFANLVHELGGPFIGGFMTLAWSGLFSLTRFNPSGNRTIREINRYERADL